MKLLIQYFPQFESSDVYILDVLLQCFKKNNVVWCSIMTYLFCLYYSVITKVIHVQGFLFLFLSFLSSFLSFFLSPPPPPPLSFFLAARGLRCSV